MNSITRFSAEEQSACSLVSLNASIGAADWLFLIDGVQTIAEYILSQAEGDGLIFNGHFAVLESLESDSIEPVYDISILMETDMAVFLAERIRELLTCILGCGMITATTHTEYEDEPALEIIIQFEEQFQSEVYSVSISVNGEKGYLHQAGKMMCYQLGMAEA